jgi:hypothetical protein
MLEGEQNGHFSISVCSFGTGATGFEKVSERWPYKTVFKTR